MKTIAEMIPEYESNLDALRSRRLELLELRKYEPRFEVRHQFTERIVAINKIIASSAAALEVMQRYGK
nr:hypothetical protein [uncultured Agathobaculum sp.]